MEETIEYLLGSYLKYCKWWMNSCMYVANAGIVILMDHEIHYVLITEVYSDLRCLPKDWSSIAGIKVFSLGF